MKLSLAAASLLSVTVSLCHQAAAGEAPQCTSADANGVCLDAAASSSTSTCGLYLAESSIPFAGWGMYSNKAIAEGEAIEPLDVAIQTLDSPAWVKDDEHRSWLLSEYYWSADMTKAQWDADDVESVIPGFGMLANSHTGLVNTRNDGAVYRRPWTDRSNPVTGSFSHYQEITFTANADIAKGQEIFVEYGDQWFAHRADKFGMLPLSNDFASADALLQAWEGAMDGFLDDPVADDVWQLAVDMLTTQDTEFERMFNALPKTGAEAAAWMDLYPLKTTASATVPNMIRSEEWLEENGMCLDNIQVQDAGDKGRGAFATRFLPAGSLVTPAPVVHLSREHMKLKWEDSYDVRRPNNTDTLWEGDQLLLNYCFGNPMTSLLFFPYAPAVNLVNHGQTPNVAIRWSNKASQPEMFDWTTQQVLAQNHKAGLMMEIYALKDIQPGDEILLDYGDDWNHSFDTHYLTWVHPLHSEDYKVAWDYDTADELFTVDDPEYPPSYVETRCWVDYAVDTEDDEGFFEFRQLDSDDIEDTVPCTLLAKVEEENLGTFYNVDFYDEEAEKTVKVKGVGWNFITYIDKAYTGNQHLRQGFRHFIGIPDEMIPPSWRDMGIDVEDNSECGMYLAESSIPFSGLGMYTARDIKKDDRIFFGDVVIQAEDINDNTNLRHRNNGETTWKEKEWLLEHYFWTAESSVAQYDAGYIQSMVPGFGMLANSHTGIHNSEMRLPTQTLDLHRCIDPGAGVATTYHDVHYVAEHNMEAGTEIFVEYGDGYFSNRQDLSFVPLSNDYVLADMMLAKFEKLVKNDLESEMAGDLWDIIEGCRKSPTRLHSALPKTLDELKAMRKAKIGTAKNSVPDRVRSVEWLKENGDCIDNIAPGKSKIIQAGRGAFATRRIKKGDVVTPVPLVQILRQHIELYDADVIDQPTEIWAEGYQLLLNYVFGHPESSLLLYPYTPVVNYVNHHNESFNAELRWSTLPNHHSEWLDQPHRDFVNLDTAGLIMDMVATRDIEVGEEVYLHYGDDWQQEWDQYAAEWKPDQGDESYIPASVLNKQVEWLRTTEELQHDPYPDNVFTGCFLPGNFHNFPSKKEVQWRYTPVLFTDASHVSECVVVARVTEATPEELENERDSFSPPSVKYTIQMNRDGKAGPLTVTGVPRRAIMFLDQMYSNDQYRRKAFRHEMYLPDEMVPNAWRDLKL